MILLNEHEVESAVIAANGERRLTGAVLFGADELRRYTEIIESAVLAKIKAQGASALAATSDDGVVEALGFNQSKSRFTTPRYRLPEGD